MNIKEATKIIDAYEELSDYVKNRYANITKMKYGNFDSFFIDEDKIYIRYFRPFRSSSAKISFPVSDFFEREAAETNDSSK